MLMARCLGVMARPHAAAARCQFGDVPVHDALLCHRLPVALRNAGIHSPSVLPAPTRPPPSIPENFDS